MKYTLNTRPPHSFIHLSIYLLSVQCARGYINNSVQMDNSYSELTFQGKKQETEQEITKGVITSPEVQ